MPEGSTSTVRSRAAHLIPSRLQPTSRNQAVRAAIPAAVIAGALVAAVLIVVLWAPAAAGTPTQVYMEAENERLVVSLAGLEIGQAETQEKDGTTTEQTRWTRLTPADEADSKHGTVLLGEGKANGDQFTHVRMIFAGVKVARDHTLHELMIPQDTLEIQLAEPGAAGDALLIALDAEKSITEEDGFLTFRPRILDTFWEPGGAKNSEPPVRPERPTGDGDPSNPPLPDRPAPTTVHRDTSDRVQSDKPPTVGRLHVAMIGNGTGLVDSLNVSLSKIALKEPDGSVDTVYENAANRELVRGPEQGVAEIAAVQVKPGTYTQVHFEFINATTSIGNTGHRQATVPQPWLVLEAPFNVTAGQAVGLVVELGVEDSLRIGLEGLEFRPVIWDYHINDSEGRDVKQPYPAQYRTGGGWLPSLGDQLDDELNKHELDPDYIPHPVGGDQDRDPRSEGSINDLDQEELDKLLDEGSTTVDDAEETTGGVTGGLT